MGGAFKTAKAAATPWKKGGVRASLNVLTGGGHDLIRRQGGFLGDLAKFPEKMAGQGDKNYKPGENPYAYDPVQAEANMSAIRGLGDAQYDETNKAIDTQGKAAQDYAAQTFQKLLPQTAEDYNAGHLLNSTGYQNEASRQAYNLANDVAYRQSQARLGALGAKQGFGKAALGRGLSLEDFAAQAKVAHDIGKISQPPPPSAKGGALSGGAAGAQAGSVAGPWGALIGGVGGAFLGSRSAEQQGGNGGGGK